MGGSRIQSKRHHHAIDGDVDCKVTSSSVTIKFRNMRSSKSPSKYCSKRASDMA